MYSQVFSAAKEVDKAFVIIFGFAVFVLAAVTILMLWFLWRYHHTRHPKPADIDGSVWAEIVWTVLPTLIVLGLFWTGWTSFKAMRTIPDGAMVVEAEGRMWSWKFTYDNGKTSDILVVPVNTPVKLALSAKDVIHSFYVPAMRLKWDMVPGMDTDAWFESDAIGDFDIFCAEYCGLRHSDMVTTLRVVSLEDYTAWLDRSAPAKAETAGSSVTSGPDPVALMQTNGCLDCHDYDGSMDGSQDIAPRLDGIGKTEVTLLLPDQSEKTAVRDADYLRRAILDPSAEIVSGFDDGMYSYEGELSEADLEAMVGYLLDPTALPAAPTVHPGQLLAEEEGCLACHSTDGTDGVGPTLAGLAGSRRTVEAETGGPRQVTADPAYLRESIRNPSTLITEGYYDGMPPYDDMSEDRLRTILDWLGTMGTRGTRGTSDSAGSGAKQ